MSTTTNVIAYADGQYGELLCADHGRERDELIAANPENGDEDRLSPVMSWDSVEGSSVEYCAAGHSFCAHCGSDMDTTRGSWDADTAGHLARCNNCNTESVYVDGVGYDYVGSWSDALDTHNVEVYGVTVTYQTDLNGYAKVGAVVDEHTGPLYSLHAYAGFMAHDPSAGVVLVLATSWEDAFSAAQDHFLEDDNADTDNFDAMDVEVVEVKRDQLWFTSKN